MASTIQEQSTTAASNTTVAGIGVQEGCAPSVVNDAIRGLTAQVAGAFLAVSASGTNTVTATLAPAPAAYVSGALYAFKATGANTTSSTFNANSLGAKEIKKITPSGKVSLAGGELVAGGFCELRYDGVDMLLQTAAPNVGGKVAQVAFTSYSAVSSVSASPIPQDDTIPQNTEGNQFMALSITPMNIASTLVIEADAFFAVSTSSAAVALSLCQDSTANALAARGVFQLTASGSNTIPLRYSMAAGTVSATTFKIRIGANITSTVTFNGGGGSRLYGGVVLSTMRITEFLP